MEQLGEELLELVSGSLWTYYLCGQSPAAGGNWTNETTNCQIISGPQAGLYHYFIFTGGSGFWSVQSKFIQPGQYNGGSPAAPSTPVSWWNGSLIYGKSPSDPGINQSYYSSIDAYIASM
jgi:hypothetical protein